MPQMPNVLILYQSVSVVFKMWTTDTLQEYNRNRRKVEDMITKHQLIRRLCMLMDERVRVFL